MRLRIQNLGPVRHASVTVKPLTVFVGPNSTGKTWTATALGAILGQHGWERYMDRYLEGQADADFPLLDQAAADLVRRGSASLSMLQFTQRYALRYFDDVARQSVHWLNEYLRSSEIDFSGTTLRLEGLDRKRLRQRVLHAPAYKSLMTLGKEGRKVHVEKLPGDSWLQVFTEGEGRAPAKRDQRLLRVRFQLAAFMLLHRAVHRNTWFFPTERASFLDLAFQSGAKAAEAEIDVRGDSPDVDGEKVAWIPPMGVTAFFQQMRVLGSKRHSVKDSHYSALADVLAERVLGGSVTLSGDGSTQRQRVLFSDGSAELELSAASSMIKELAPLVLYLRHQAEPGDCLIIDEPEMNLHPEAQCKLVEFLAMLVNTGLNVLFTTHSPYMVDHLKNLMEAAAQPDDGDALAQRFFLGDSMAFIAQEKISIYLFQDGTAKSILDEEGAVDWRTFSRVSDRINEIYLSL